MLKIEYRLADGKLRQFSTKEELQSNKADELLYLALKSQQPALVEAIESFILSPISAMARWQYVADAAGVTSRGVDFAVNGELQFALAAPHALGRNKPVAEVRNLVAEFVDAKPVDEANKGDGETPPQQS